MDELIELLQELVAILVPEGRRAAARDLVLVAQLGHQIARGQRAADGHFVVDPPPRCDHLGTGMYAAVGKRNVPGDDDVFPVDVLRDPVVGGIRIAGIFRTDWFRTGAAAAHGNVRAGTDVRIPLGTRNYHGQSSVIAIQNPSASSAASVELEFIASDDAANRMERTMEIDFGRSHTIDLGTDPEFAGLGDGFLGALAIRNPMGIGAQSFLVSGSAGSTISAFAGRPLESADETLYAPLIRNDFYGTTGISVHNPGGQPVDVTVEYHGAQGACAGRTFRHGPATIDARSSAVVYQGNVEVDGTGTSPLPRGCVGSAVIRSDAGAIMAVVNDVGDASAAA